MNNYDDNSDDADHDDADHDDDNDNHYDKVCGDD